MRRSELGEGEIVIKRYDHPTGGWGSLESLIKKAEDEGLIASGIWATLIDDELLGIGIARHRTGGGPSHYDDAAEDERDRMTGRMRYRVGSFSEQLFQGSTPTCFR